MPLHGILDESGLYFFLWPRLSLNSYFVDKVHVQLQNGLLCTKSYCIQWSFATTRSIFIEPYGPLVGQAEL